MSRYDPNTEEYLTDDLWNQIKNTLPGREGKPGAKGNDNRLFMEAIIWILRTGNTWRALPEERFGKWYTAYTRYNRWTKNGVWNTVVEALEAAGCHDFSSDHDGLHWVSRSKSPNLIPEKKAAYVQEKQEMVANELEPTNIPNKIKSFFREVLGGNLVGPASKTSPIISNNTDRFEQSDKSGPFEVGLIRREFEQFYEDKKFKQHNITKQTESDEQIDARLRESFEALREITARCIHGDFRSLIVSGAPGLGKTFEIEKQLRAYSPDGRLYSIVRGHAKASGLYPCLYKFRNRNNILVMDDADAIFGDDVSLNILKAATDSNDRRVISWLSRTKLTELDDEGNTLPRSFEYNGVIIFITNLDFDEMIRRGNKLAPHMEALMSRSLYVDLTMRTPRDCLVRIRQVVEDGLNDRNGILAGLSGAEQKEVIEFIEKNYLSFREISLRSAKKIANLRKGGGNWEAQAKFAMFR